MLELSLSEILTSFVSTAPSSVSGRIECVFIDSAIELRSEAICHFQASSGRCFSLNNRAVACITSQLRKACCGNHAPVLVELVCPVHIQ